MDAPTNNIVAIIYDSLCERFGTPQINAEIPAITKAISTHFLLNPVHSINLPLFNYTTIIQSFELRAGDAKIIAPLYDQILIHFSKLMKSYQLASED